MQVNKFGELVSLNNYLEETTSSLKRSLEGNSGRQDDDLKAKLEAVMVVIHENEGLLKGGQPDQTIRFIKNVKQFTEFVVNAPETPEKQVLLQAATKTITVSFNILGKNDINGTMVIIRDLEKIDQDLYKQSLANWISHNQIPIKQLNLTEKEMLEVVPLLTYLDLTDAKHRTCENCSFTEDFIGNLLENSRNLKHLIIRNSRIDGSAFARFRQTQNLQQLTIKSCPAFNQKLFGMQNLQQLTIYDCEAFNQKMEGMPNLQQLTLHSCNVFNQKLEEMPSLKELSISFCYVFNQKLESTPILEKLRIEYCDIFNQELEGMHCLQQLNICCNGAFNQKLVGMQNLQKLNIDRCKVFNQKLKGMQNLQELNIESCSAFNQKLKEMPRLRDLKISFSKAYNQGLDGMQSLQRLSLFGCVAFNPFDHSLRTALIIFRNELKIFSSCWNKLSIEERQQKITSLLENQTEIENIAKNTPAQLINLINAFEISEEVFVSRYPHYQILLTLGSLEQLVRKGESKELIQRQFSSLKERPNYLDYLLESIRLFPYLTTFLIQNLREEVINDIRELQISFETLPQDNRMALLPICSPDVIKKIVIGIPDEEKIQWLQFPLQHERFSGSAEAVLKAIKENNLENASASDLDNLLVPIRELLNKLPLKILAACASLDGNTLMSYCFAMEETHKSVVIPLLDEKKLLQYLERQPFEIQRELLSYATIKQKECYLIIDLLKNKPIEEWDLIQKSELKKQICAFKEDKTGEKYKELEALWRKILFPLNTAVQQYPQTLQSMKKVLLKFDPNTQFIQKVQNFIEPKIAQVIRIHDELQQMGTEIAKLAMEISGSVKIPDEFIDIITGEPMKDPYTDNHGNTLDKSTWDRITINPFTREPMVKTPISQNNELKKQIDVFRKEHQEL